MDFFQRGARYDERDGPKGLIFWIFFHEIWSHLFKISHLLYIIFTFFLHCNNYSQKDNNFQIIANTHTIFDKMHLIPI